MPSKQKQKENKKWEGDLEKLIKKYTGNNGYFCMVDGFIPLADFIRQLFLKKSEELVEEIEKKKCEAHISGVVAKDAYNQGLDTAINIIRRHK